MRSVFIFIAAFLACATVNAQDVANSAYPAPVDSSRKQTRTESSGTDYLPIATSTVGSIAGTNFVMTLPTKWASRPVMVEIYNEKGILIRSITEKKASPFIVVSLEGIPLGAYELRTRCGKETTSQLTIIAGHS